MSDVRRCTKCGEEKALDGFHKQKAGKHGVASRCKVCCSAEAKTRPKDRDALRAAQRRYQERHPERLRARRLAAYKANPERSKASTAKWIAANRDEYLRSARERQARYRAEHPWLDRESCKRWRENHPERHKARQDRWEAANRERMRPHRRKKQAARRAADPKHNKRLAADWRERNRDKCRAYRETRRALKANAPGRGITGEQWAGIRASTLGVCSYCSQPSNITIDHIIPLISGGSHDVTNAGPACLPCNQSKGATPLIAWLAKRYET